MLNERGWIPQSFFYPLMKDHDVFSQDHDQIFPDSQNSNWIYPDREIANFLARLFSKVPQVKSICAQFGPEEITIWTLLEHYDRKAREQVYKKELEICQTFGLYDFDFRVSSVDLISPNELVRLGGHEIYKRP